MSCMSRVLIVDDDTALLQALPDAITFRFPGTVVETTWSGQTALDMAQTTDYEAVVVDLKMSGLNGLEVIARLQTSPSKHFARALMPSSKNRLIATSS